MIHIIFILFGEPSCPVDGSFVFPEVATPFRIEMFHHIENRRSLGKSLF